MRMKIFLFGWLVTLCVLCDQWSKYLAIEHLSYGSSQKITSFLNLTLLYNTGAAFGFLHNQTGWQQSFFLIVGIIALIVIAMLLFRYRQRFHAAAFYGLTFLSAGALGNMLDRYRFGYVVDFLDFHYQQWHWPAFNVADICISVGALLCVYWELRRPKVG